MADKVNTTGVSKESGFLYYLDKNGHVSRTKMARGATKGGTPEVVANGGTGPLYAFIEGTITAGDTAGHVDLQAAQNTSSATATTIKFGTYLEYLKF